MELLNTNWVKSIQAFGKNLRKDSVASLATVGSFGNIRRQSRLSEIFGVCGPTPAGGLDLDTIAEQDPLPTPEAMDDLLKLVILDRNRNKTPFVDLVKSTSHHRNIVIFIRHFFCPVGPPPIHPSIYTHHIRQKPTNTRAPQNCFGYVKALANELPPEKLAQMDPPTTVTIVGCGDPILIQNYMKMTNCPYDIYADPSRSTYAALGFAVNETAAEEVPKYVQRYSTTSVFKAILISLGLAVRSRNIAAGKTSQNGGELIWIDGKLQYIHRMRNTNDHLEVDQLDWLLRN